MHTHIKPSNYPEATTAIPGLPRDAICCRSLLLLVCWLPCDANPGICASSRAVPAELRRALLRPCGGAAEAPDLQT